METILEIKDLSFSYALTPEKKSLENINMNVKKGEIIGICGLSGSGKSTLLKSIKKEIQPVGKSVGDINLNINSTEIGIVLQNIDSQLISNTVLENLVFQMENLNYDKLVMKKRVSEICAFFGLDFVNQEVKNLSSGQKQLVNLCGILMTYPKLLLLDEPLSQLDPISIKKIIETIRYINNEGVSIIIIEHKFDDIIDIVDKIGLMDDGQLKYFDNKDVVLKEIYKDENLSGFIPDIPKISLDMNVLKYLPSELKITKEFTKKELIKKSFKDDVLTIKSLSYIVPNSNKIVLNNMNLNIKENEIFSILGGNGVGKTTLLKILCNIKKGLKGKIQINKKIGYMPQEVKSYFIYDTVLEEIGIENELVEQFDIKDLLYRNPLDLSPGEMQKVILISLFNSESEVLILDEPTKSLDWQAKEILGDIFLKINKTIILTTHDLDFAARYSNRCGMLFNGDFAYIEKPYEFFNGNKYYTTPINKVFKDRGVLIKEEVVFG